MSRYRFRIIHTIIYISFIILTIRTFVNFKPEENDTFMEIVEDPKKEPIRQRVSLKDYKLIVLWTNYSDSIDWGNPHRNDPDFFKKINCPETRCRVILPAQRNDYPVTEYDALLFNGYNVLKTSVLPEKRLPHQIYIFTSMEPPFTWWLSVVNFNVTYNFTISYRPDSDMFAPYFRVMDLTTNQYVSPFRQGKWKQFEKDFTDKKLIETAKNKKKTLVAVISDCTPESKRNILVKDLQKHIDFDVFGRCGTLKCDIRELTCSKKIDAEYRFYAAFENSLCENYVSEKFFFALKRNLVPIVYGGANYANFAPPHSYIDIADFENYEALAKYLKYLNEHPEEYVKYFWWKKYYRPDGNFLDFCELCQRLHSPRLQNQVKFYKNIKEYWYDRACAHTAKNISDVISKDVLGGSTVQLKKNIKQ